MRILRGRAPLLLATCGLLACGEAVGPERTSRASVPVPAFLELSPEQQALIAQPVSAEAAAGRVATRQDLEDVRGWFAPGELEALLATANRRAAARGDDTLPHCIPLCGHPAPQR
jgi:predicted transcriptional regulator